MLQMESRLRTRHSSQEDREVYVELAEHELEEEEEELFFRDDVEECGHNY